MNCQYLVMDVSCLIWHKIIYTLTEINCTRNHINQLKLNKIKHHAHKLMYKCLGNGEETAHPMGLINVHFKQNGSYVTYTGLQPTLIQTLHFVTLVLPQKTFTGLIPFFVPIFASQKGK